MNQAHAGHSSPLRSGGVLAYQLSVRNSSIAFM